MLLAVKGRQERCSLAYQFLCEHFFLPCLSKTKHGDNPNVHIEGEDSMTRSIIGVSKNVGLKSSLKGNPPPTSNIHHKPLKVNLTRYFAPKSSAIGRSLGDPNGDDDDINLN